MVGLGRRNLATSVRTWPRASFAVAHADRVTPRRAAGPPPASKVAFRERASIARVSTATAARARGREERHVSRAVARGEPARLHGLPRIRLPSEAFSSARRVARGARRTEASRDDHPGCAPRVAPARGGRVPRGSRVRAPRASPRVRAPRRLGALRGMPKRRGASVLSAGAADGDDAGRHGGGDAYLAAKHP